MSSTSEPAGLQDADFETIEAAVNETARGRWFLAEYARRNRAAETDRLVAALTRIERAVDMTQPRESFDAARFRAAADDLARRLDDIVRQLRSTRSGSYISGALAEQALRAAALAQALQSSVVESPRLSTAPQPLRLEMRQSADDADERRLIAQRMIEPSAFFVPKEPLDVQSSAPEAAPQPTADVVDLGSSGRLSDRLDAMRRFDAPAASPQEPAGPSLAEIDAMPLRDKLRFFG
ncbi:MAG: hypothetical protein Q7T73_11550 [Beijerinckiaceae bacterium]|nr:hypothetical protein [Beijerinckiaceae bacterium]